MKSILLKAKQHNMCINALMHKINIQDNINGLTFYGSLFFKIKKTTNRFVQVVYIVLYSSTLALSYLQNNF